MSNQRSIDQYFNKSFEFAGNEHWVLPSEAYKTSPWHIETLQQMKIQLNTVKGQLSKFNLDEWSKHTRLRDPSSFIVSTLKSKGKIELLTQAWCKFYECLSRYPVVPTSAICKHKLTSLHLCEAPGAFVSALNHYLYTHYRKVQWNWHATTLNPCYEANPASDMIADDRLIRHTADSWDFGVDQTGDLMKYYNHEALAHKLSDVMLVTADGSVDCMKDPGEQESNVHFLHYCETITALKILQKRGTFVLKIFTMFEHCTICLVYLLNCCFTKVRIFKPCASKSGNSEVYIICLGYKGWMVLENVWESLVAPYKGCIRSETSAMFCLSQINTEFLRQLEECVEFFMGLQSCTINENVRHFVGDAQTNCEEIDELKRNVADYFIKIYPISFHIPKRRKLIKNLERRRFKSISESEWDFKTITVPGDSSIMQSLNLDIKIGKALEAVVASRFCQVKFTQQHGVADSLLQAVRTFLPSTYSIVQNLDFREGLLQYEFQREFFYALKERVENCCDIVLIGIPLLTRFIVGFVYVLALGFESVLVYKKGVIILRNPSESKLAIVRGYCDIIDTVYRSLTVDKFVPDILQVMPGELLESESFYHVICRYNNGLFEE